MKTLRFIEHSIEAFTLWLCEGIQIVGAFALIFIYGACQYILWYLLYPLHAPYRTKRFGKSMPLIIESVGITLAGTVCIIGAVMGYRTGVTWIMYAAVSTFGTLYLVVGHWNAQVCQKLERLD